MLRRDVESYASIPTQAIDENKVLGEIQEVNSKLAQYAREFKGPVTDKDFEAAQQFVDTQLESLEEHHDARAIEGRRIFPNRRLSLNESFME